jgi:hypothetical protein
VPAQRRKLCSQLVDTVMDRAPFVREFALPTLCELVGKRIEAVVQFSPQRRDLQFAPLELYELDCECIQIRELGDRHVTVSIDRGSR